jgi:hypothetical protein
MRLKHARAILGYHLPPFIPSARAVVRAFSFGDVAAEALRALSAAAAATGMITITPVGAAGATRTVAAGFTAGRGARSWRCPAM